jgi:hypothetical protein
MPWRTLPSVGLTALAMLIAGCADRPPQTAAADHGTRAHNGCLSLRPPPPFTHTRGQTMLTRTDVMTRC